jgi:hypothetical protein
MSEPSPASTPNPAPAAEAAEFHFDTRSAVPVYANAIRAAATPGGEIILDCGLNDQHSAAAGPPTIAVAHRLVLSYPTAQRLARLLHAVLQACEQVYRPAVRVQRVQAPARPAAAPPPPEPPSDTNNAA